MDAASGAIQGKGKVDVMEDYKLRMINEYKNLEEKYNKLHKMLVKYDAGKLDFTPTCPIDLLRKQASFMGQYLLILSQPMRLYNSLYETSFLVDSYIFVPGWPVSARYSAENPSFRH